MDDFLTQALTSAATKFPKVLAGYIAVCGLYTFFCFVASMTPSPKDDEFLGRFKRFFSLPVKAPKDGGQQ
jgi:hypothetical protein